MMIRMIMMMMMMMIIIIIMIVAGKPFVCCHSISATVAAVYVLSLHLCYCHYCICCHPCSLLLPLCTCCHSVSAAVAIVSTVTCVCCHFASATVTAVSAVTPSPQLVPLRARCHSVSATVAIVSAVTCVRCVWSLVPAMSVVTPSPLLLPLRTCCHSVCATVIIVSGRLCPLCPVTCARGVCCHYVATTVAIVSAVTCVRCIRSLVLAVSAVTCVIISVPPPPPYIGRYPLLGSFAVPVVSAAMSRTPDEPSRISSRRPVPSVFVPTMARTHVNSAHGLPSGRASIGAVGVPAARPESGPTEQLAGDFLFPNTGPDDDHLGREPPTLRCVGTSYAKL